MKISAPLLRRAVVYRAAVSSPSPLVGEGRGGGSRGCGPIAPHSRTPTPDPSPAEPRYSEGSATQQSDRSRQQPTSVGDGGKTTSLPCLRLAEPFEALRDGSDRMLERTGVRPKIFLANLGKAADFTARATYAKNFFEAS